MTVCDDATAMAITSPRTKMTMTMKTTSNDKNHAEDDDNTKLIK